MDVVFGVVEVPYTGHGHGDVTTGDVAGWLEDKYHVMEIFAEDNLDFIAEALTDAVADVMDNILAGAPPPQNPYLEGADVVQTRFKAAIDADFMKGHGYPGVPTQAALNGVRTALKLKKGDPRASFFDTGLYANSMRVWIE